MSEPPDHASPPRSPFRLRNRGWKIAGGVAGVLLFVVAACEIAGWPFLAKPVQNALGDVLHRQVLLRVEGTQEGATVRFLGGVKARVPALQIGAPEWSERPYFLHARNADMRVSYGALWRASRGAPLDIQLLQADELVVHAERRADGRASWMFGDPAAPPKPDDAVAEWPTVRNLRVLQGELTFVDAILKADITGTLQLDESIRAATAAARPPQPLPTALQGLVASAQGTYGGAALTARLRSVGVTPLLRNEDDAEAVPVQLELKAGRAALSFSGTVGDVLNLSRMNGVFRVTGPSLAAVGDPLGVTLPTTGAFVLAGRVAKTGQVWNVVTQRATVGASQLKAEMTYDMRPSVPRLSGRVTGPRLLLADLAPTIGGAPQAAPAPPPGASAPASARVLPDKEFDLPSLRAMNANVVMAFDRVELGSLFATPLQPLRTHLVLQDGKLSLNDVVARTAEGDVRGQVSLDGTGDVARWRADLRWSGVKLENWLNQERANNAPPYVSGRLVGRATVSGQGRSTAQILGSLQGNVITTLRQGQVSHLIIEAAGLDLADAVGVLLKGDEPLPVNCALADMRAEGGVLYPRALVVDTRDSTVWADGQVSLKDETLALRAVVSPKDFSPLALRTPIRVNGPFNSPQVSLEKGPLARKVAGAVLLSFLNPVAALVPLLDLGHGEQADTGCDALLQRAREAARTGVAR